MFFRIISHDYTVIRSVCGCYFIVIFFRPGWQGPFWRGTRGNAGFAGGKAWGAGGRLYKLRG